MATKLGIRNYSRTGNTVTFTVLALNADNTVDTSFTGTVTFSLVGVSDPGTYSFTLGDQGRRAFTTTVLDTTVRVGLAANSPSIGGANLSIASSGDNNTGFGNVGNHLLVGGSGNNTYSGNVGDDLFLVEQGGNDTLNGAAGNNGFYFGAAFTAADRVDGGAGVNDQVGLQGSYPDLTLSAAQLTTVEVVALLPTAGATYGITTLDDLVPAGVTMTFYASELAAGQNFTFDGGAETDGAFSIYGGLGRDIITTGAGNDGIYFGNGRFDPANDRVKAGAGTDDQLALDGNYTITLDGNAVQGVEVLVLLDGRVEINNNYSIDLANSLVPAGGTFTVRGTAVRSGMIIDGGQETDAASLVILGGAGGDQLFGSSGADRIVGNGGNDTLLGRGGADRFEFSGAALGPGNVDTILDFLSGTDTIALSTALFAGLVAGGLNPIAFLSGPGVNAATSVDHRIIYNRTTGQLFFDPDGTGAAAAVQFASLFNTPALVASDFLIVTPV